MVTGAYYPELSGGGLQCRNVVRTLRDQVRFTILATATDASLPRTGETDGVSVCRVPVDMRQRWWRLRTGWRLACDFVRLRNRIDIVHLHGFSSKSALLVLLAKLFRKKLIVKLSLVGEDDPASVGGLAGLSRWCYRRADRFWAVSRRLQELYESAGMPKGKCQLMPNGVDLERFRPATEADRRRLRGRLGLAETARLILFVGIFAPKKRPDVLFDAWLRLREQGICDTRVVFVGATRSGTYGVDPALADRIRRIAQRFGLEKDLVFVERSLEIEHYYQAADVFVLPSDREGLPNALLEAMAASLPCVASRLRGITDQVIDHGVNGLLVPAADPAALATTLRFVLENPDAAWAMGRRARDTVERSYSLAAAGARYLEGYQSLAGL